jgi:hypothetical protein
MRQLPLFLTFTLLSLTAYSQYNTPDEKNTAIENLMEKAEIPGLSAAYFDYDVILVIVS